MKLMVQKKMYTGSKKMYTGSINPHKFIVAIASLRFHQLL